MNASNLHLQWQNIGTELKGYKWCDLFRYDTSLILIFINIIRMKRKGSCTLQNHIYHPLLHYLILLSSFTI